MIRCPNCRCYATERHFMLHPECDAELGRLCGLRGVRKRKVVVAGTGRSKSAGRCPCGIMTAARAAARKHVCSGILAITEDQLIQAMGGGPVELILPGGHSAE